MTYFTGINVSINIYIYDAYILNKSFKRLFKWDSISKLSKAFRSSLKFLQFIS